MNWPNWSLVTFRVIPDNLTFPFEQKTLNNLFVCLHIICDFFSELLLSLFYWPSKRNFLDKHATVIGNQVLIHKRPSGINIQDSPRPFYYKLKSLTGEERQYWLPLIMMVHRKIQIFDFLSFPREELLPDQQKFDISKCQTWYQSWKIW